MPKISLVEHSFPGEAIRAELGESHKTPAQGASEGTMTQAGDGDARRPWTHRCLRMRGRR